MIHFVPNKVGRVFPIVVVSKLPLAEFEYNDHLEDETHFSLKIDRLTDFSNITKNEMKKKDEIKRKFILPNFSFGTPGRLASIDETLKDGDQFMVLGNERFQVPELLFNPNDAMIRQVEYS